MITYTADIFDGGNKCRKTVLTHLMMEIRWETPLETQSVTRLVTRLVTQLATWKVLNRCERAYVGHDRYIRGRRLGKVVNVGHVEHNMGTC